MKITSLDFFSATPYVMVCKPAIKFLGAEVALIFCELCSKYKYHFNNNSLTNGEFFYTQKLFESEFGFTEYKQRTILNKLADLQLLEIERKGVKGIRYIKLNLKNIEDLFESLILKNLDTENLSNLKIKYSDTENLSISIYNTNTKCIKEEINNKEINNIIKEKNTKKEKTPNFVKPTFEELQEYSKSIGFNLDCEYFLDHYESVGWKIGKNSMKNWKATVRKWKTNDFNKTKNTQKPIDKFKPGVYEDSSEAF